MRQLKFRVWCPLRKRFALNTEDGYIYQEDDFSNGEFRVGCGDGEVIQQFTGLKDKNGKDIYEGDLLARPLHSLPTYFEVYWNGASAKFNTAVHYKHNKMIATYPIVADDFCNAEVAGNIFQNPELLQTKRK